MNKEQLMALGLSEEQADKALGLHNEDVEGLKSKNSELLGKFETYKTNLSEKERTIAEAREVAVKAEEQKLLAEGKYKEAQELREAERAELIAKAEGEAKRAQDALKARDLNDVQSQIMRNVHPDFEPAAKALLNANTDISYGEQGEVKAIIRHGDKEFTSVADFGEFAKTDPTWSAMLKAPDTQGVGAQGSSSGQAAGGSNENAEFHQRLQNAGLIT